VAAPPGGVSWIPARRVFTKEDDGLAQEWTGLVWCNPPFGGGVAAWARCFRDHANGVLLTPIPGNRRWFPDLFRAGALAFYADKSIAFSRPADKPTHVQFPVVLLALGDVGKGGLRRLARAVPGVLIERAK
jgi:hypothetical protein